MSDEKIQPGEKVLMRVFLREVLPADVNPAAAQPMAIVFDPEEFSPKEVCQLLTIFADYYRACGGIGLDAILDEIGDPRP